MSVQIDFCLPRGVDATLPFQMNPPASIAGMSLQFQVMKYFGGVSGLITKSLASGYTAGQSGMSAVNVAQGIASIAILAANTSGMAFGSYAYEVRRTDAGHNSELTAGFFTLSPTLGG